MSCVAASTFWSWELNILWIGSDRLLQEVFDATITDHSFHFAKSIDDAKRQLDGGLFDLALIDVHPLRQLQSSKVEYLAAHRNLRAAVVMTTDYYFVFSSSRMRKIIAGYWPKEISLDSFKALLHSVDSGEKKFFPQSAWRRVVGNYDIEVLSERDLTALRLLALGYTFSEVAKELEISRSELSEAMRSVYSKLSVKNRVAAAVNAFDNCLL